MTHHIPALFATWLIRREHSDLSALPGGRWRARGENPAPRLRRHATRARGGAGQWSCRMHRGQTASGSAGHLISPNTVVQGGV